MSATQRPEKQSVVDLARYLGKGVQVKLGGGRQGTSMRDMTMKREDRGQQREADECVGVVRGGEARTHGVC